MKKWFLIFLFIPCLVWAGFSVDGVTDPASVDGISEPASVDGVTSDYGYTPNWYSHWNSVGEDDELCSTTPCPDTWDTISSDDDQSVSGNALVWVIRGNNPWLYDNDGYSNQIEYTIKVDFKIDETIDVSNAADSMYIFELRNDAVDEYALRAYLLTDSNGDIATVKARCDDDGGTSQYGDAVDITGEDLTGGITITAYYKRETGDGNNDGICYVRIGSTVSQLTNMQNYNYDGIGLHKLGATNNWGDGAASPSTVTWDNLRVYLGVDAR